MRRPRRRSRSRNTTVRRTLESPWWRAVVLKGAQRIGKDVHITLHRDGRGDLAVIDVRDL